MMSCDPCSEKQQMSENALVTGGAGFTLAPALRSGANAGVGLHLVDTLLK